MTGAKKVRVITKVEHITGGNVKIDLKYPQVSGLANSQVQRNLNLFFRRIAIRARIQGLKCAASLTLEDYGRSAQCETYLTYKTAYNQNCLLSLIFSNYQFSGGAHGSTIQSSYTFDIRSGRELKLGDIISTDKETIDFINSRIKKEIDRRVAAEELFVLQAFESIGKNPSFYLSVEGIVFYFQQYEYFPYAAGIQEFTIPFSDLEGKLKLRKCAGQAGFENKPS